MTKKELKNKIRELEKRINRLEKGQKSHHEWLRNIGEELK